MALVSDAGTPAVSDPGSVVVAAVREAGGRVIPVPGRERAHGRALGERHRIRGRRVRGIPSGEGHRAAREARGARGGSLGDRALRGAASHREARSRTCTRRSAIATWSSRARSPSASRRSRGCRSPSARAWVDADDDRRRGEFVLVVEAASRRRPADRFDPKAVLEALLAELPVKQAVALAVKITGGKRNELYAMALEMKGD